MNKVISLPTHYPVACHTDQVMPGGTFVAIAGFKHDGIAFVPTALAKGAKKIVVQADAVMPHEIMQLIKLHDASLEHIADTRLALAQLSAQAAGFPAQKLRIIGITGTKGKTTTSFLLEHIVRTAGYKTALLTTVHNKILDTVFPAPLTTAQPDYLHQFFKTCVEHGVEWVVMETAAQALSLHRAHDIEFDGIIFTNFSQEHAEFYPTMQEYFAAKSKIFTQARSGAPVIINADNEWLAPLAAKQGIMAIGSRTKSADWHFSVAGTNDCLQVHLYHNQKELVMKCPALLGDYNGYNIAAAVALAVSLGIQAAVCAQACATFAGVPGRLQRYRLANGATCVIDYAHNPSSFEQLFLLLRSMTDQLIVVFGAGGERDRSKRPVMGSLAASYADHVILTMDNPRSEDPAMIVQEIMLGIPHEQQSKVVCQLDRALAIKEAFTLSRPSAIIALLGKGPEEYQIIGTQKIYFSEAAIVQSLM